MFRVLTVLFLAVLSVPLNAQEKEKFVAVCSTTQIADFTRQIVGDRWNVFSVLGEGADPHTHEVSTADINLVSKADLCLENGWELEHGNWMNTMAKNAGKPIVTCVSADKIKPREIGVKGQSIKDPHAWFTPRNATVYVRKILGGLTKIDPANKVEYEARAGLYIAQLAALDKWIERQLNSIPRNKRVLITNHDAFGYFCDRYGFKAFSPQGWSTGAEIGAGSSTQRRKEVIDSIRKFGVKTIFVETSIGKERDMEQIAKDASVVIGSTLYSDSMGAPGTAGATYIGMMRENVIAIVDGLGTIETTSQNVK